MVNPLEQQLIEAGALKEGHFLLASGLHSDRYIEKFDLLRNPTATSQILEPLAESFREQAIDVVVGPTTGGILLAFELARQLGVASAYAERVDDGESARAFKRGTRFASGSRVLVIDDILTTGGSVRETIVALEPFAVNIIGVAVLVDRSNGSTSFGKIPLTALLAVDVKAWEPEKCPLCQDGVPLLKPGTTAA